MENLKNYKIVKYVGVIWNKLFSISVLKKVFLIFMIGYISRLFINGYFHVNVFVECNNVISIWYYIFMGYIAVYINEVMVNFSSIPKISSEVFNVSIIRKAIVTLFSSKDNNGGKVSLTSSESVSSVKGETIVKHSKISGVLFSGGDRNNNTGVSAGIKGLYSNGSRSGRSVGNYSDRVNGRSVGVGGSGRSVGNYPDRAKGSSVGVGVSSKVVGSSKGVVESLDREYLDRGLKSKKGVSDIRRYYENIPVINVISPNSTSLSGSINVVSPNSTPVSGSINMIYQGSIPSGVSVSNNTLRSGQLVEYSGVVNAPVVSRLTTPSDLSTISGMFPSGGNSPGVTSYQSVNTKDSIQGVVDRTPRISDIPSYSTNEGYNLDWENRQYGVITDVQYRLRELDVNTKNQNIFGKVKLGFKYLDGKLSRVEDKLDSIYIKYHDISKRKFVWTVWEKGRGNYESYQDFKLSWDPNKKVWSEIKSAVKSDLRSEIENLIHKHDPFKTDKRLDNFLDKRLKSKSRYPFRRV